MGVLTEEQRADVDALILKGSIIEGMIRIREACGVGLKDARGLFRMRYRQLRAERGAEFSCGDEEYWSNYGEDLVDAIASVSSIPSSPVTSISPRIFQGFRLGYAGRVT